MSWGLCRYENERVIRWNGLCCVVSCLSLCVSFIVCIKLRWCIIVLGVRVETWKVTFQVSLYHHQMSSQEILRAASPNHGCALTILVRLACGRRIKWRLAAGQGSGQGQAQKGSGFLAWLLPEAEKCQPALTGVITSPGRKHGVLGVEVVSRRCWCLCYDVTIGVIGVLSWWTL